ncbi:MAG: hypothetical protein IT320_26010 [Anaerolineae bacterium]|nr:hypothetical protein [Anaerolineae bacterium]
MDFIHSLTPDFFDSMVCAVIIIGIALAVVRLYSDFTRKLPPEDRPPQKNEND